MAVVSIKRLFEAGAHLGHKTQKWHPKMKPYIFGAQAGIYIIDLRQTLQKLKEAYEYVLNISANGGKILFVGTKSQARDVVKEQAMRSANFYVNLRWLGGMLTNFSTIRQSITKLKKLEDVAGPDRDYVGVLKKEAVRMEKERRKLENVLGGIVELRKRPAAIFIVDIRREFIALNEAKKLGIPVIAAVDTNCDPKDIDFMIPGNDDSIHCINLYTSVIAAASIEGRKKYETKIRELRNEKADTQKDNDEIELADDSINEQHSAAKNQRLKQSTVEKVEEDEEISDDQSEESIEDEEEEEIEGKEEGEEEEEEDADDDEESEDDESDQSEKDEEN